MVRDLNVLVLSDNVEVLERAKPIFEKRNVNRWTFTNSDDINPKKDWKHIINTYDLVFSLHCKKIFPSILTGSVRCINIHPGYNPYNRGIFPHVFSIVNGLPAGVTIHEMTSEVDLGPCITQSDVPIKENDTSGSLYKRIIEMEMVCIDRVLDNILAKDYSVRHYVGKGNYNSMKDFIELCDCSIILGGNFFNRLRALSHPGFMNAHYNGIKFKLIIDENPNQSDH